MTNYLKTAKKTSIHRAILLVATSFFFVFLFSIFQNSTNVAASANQEISFQTKIVNKADGTNVVSGSPACVIAGSSNDTCDFRVSVYANATGGTALWSEIHQDVEIGAYNGILTLKVGSYCITNQGGSWITDNEGGSRCNVSGGGVDWGADSTLYMQIDFDTANTSGANSFSSPEIFTEASGDRMLIRSVPTALYADEAGSIDGLDSGDFVRFIPGTAQLSGNAITSLIHINEDGSSSPNLIEIETGGVDMFVVDNSGDTTIAGNLALNGASINSLYGINAGSYTLDNQRAINLTVSADTDGDDIYGMYTAVNVGTGNLANDRNAYGAYYQVTNGANSDAGFNHIPRSYGSYTFLDSTADSSVYKEMYGHYIATRTNPDGSQNFSGDNTYLNGITVTLGAGGTGSGVDGYYTSIYLEDEVSDIAQYSTGSAMILASMGSLDTFTGYTAVDSSAGITGGSATGFYVDIDDADIVANSYSFYVESGSAKSYFGSDTLIGGGNTVATANTILGANGSAIFNEQGADVDFRVEGDTQANLFFVDASTDRVGIGTSTPNYRLTVQTTSAVTSGTDVGIYSNINAAAASASSGNYYGMWGVATATGSQNYTGSIRGYLGSAQHSGTGTVSSLYGGFVQGNLGDVTGNVTNAYGLGVQINNSSTLGGVIGTARLINLETPTNTGVITNLYGLYLNNMNVGSTTNVAILTNSGNIIFNEGGDANTDFRVEGDTNANLFFVDASADAVGIGTSTPVALFSVGSSSQFQVSSIGNITQTVTGANGEHIIDGSQHVYIMLDRGAAGNNAGIRFRTAGTVNWSLGTGDDVSNKFYLTTNGSTPSSGAVLTALTTGQIGIGDTTPASLFTVGNGDTFQVNTSGDLIKINNVTYAWPSSQAAGSGYVLSNNGLGTLTWVAAGSNITVGSMTGSPFFADSTADDDWLGLGASAGRIEFDDQTTDEVNILGADVGIGTNAPSRLLDISGSGAIMRVTNTANSYSVEFGFPTASEPALSMYTTGITSGRVVQRQNSTKNVFIGDIDANGGGLVMRTNGTDKAVILSTGEFGIGDITPASLFTVGNGDLFQVNSSGNIVKINNITYSWPSSQAAGSGYVLSNNGAGTLTWVAAGSGITVGSMTSSPFFADATADDDWLGLGASAGRIEFDDLTNDEVNILGANVGIGTSTPTTAKLSIDSTTSVNNLTGLYLENDYNAAVSGVTRNTFGVETYLATNSTLSSAGTVNLYGTRNWATYGGTVTNDSSGSTLQVVGADFKAGRLGSTADSAGLAYIYGIRSFAEGDVSSFADSTIYGAEIFADGNANILYGIYSGASGVGTLEEYGIYAFSGGAVTSYGVYGTSNGGTNSYGGFFTSTGGTNRHGIFVAASGGTTNYAIYSSAGTNYFADEVLIGATSESITHTSFAISGGDDMFVLGDVGIKGDLYTDAEVILGNADNVDGFLNLADGTTGKPQITFGNGGSAPSSISIGDLWWTGTQLHFRKDGSTTVDLLSPAASVTVGSMTGSTLFADSTADDDWLGLGASAGRIEFDDQTNDEVNILDAYLGVGTNSPTSLFSVGSSSQFQVNNAGNVGVFGAGINTAYGINAGTYNLDNQRVLNYTIAADTDGDDVFGIYGTVGVGSGTVASTRHAIGNYLAVTNSVTSGNGSKAFGDYIYLDGSADTSSGQKNVLGSYISNATYDTGTATYTGDRTFINGYTSDLYIGGTSSYGDGFDSYISLEDEVSDISQSGYAYYGKIQTMGATDFGYGLYVEDGSAPTAGNAYGLFIDIDDANYTDAYSVYVENGSHKSFFGSNVFVGSTSEGITNTGFVPDGNDMYISGDLGVATDVYTNGSFIAGATLTLNDGFIRDSSDINFQADGDTDDYLYLDTTSNETSILWEGVLSYTNDPGLRVNASTGELEYRDEDSLTWVAFDSLAGGGATVGSMTSSPFFADSTADDDWLGLGASAGRIEFDDQTKDEINILGANVGIGINTVQSAKLSVFSPNADENTFGISSSLSRNTVLDATPISTYASYNTVTNSSSISNGGAYVGYGTYSTSTYTGTTADDFGGSQVDLYGGYFAASSNSSTGDSGGGLNVYGVFTQASTTSNTFGLNNIYGVYSYIPGMTGVAGEVHGIFTDVDSTGSAAAYGVFSGIAGNGQDPTAGRFLAASTSANNFGIYTTATGVGTANFAIYASASGATTNYAIYSDGGRNYFADEVLIGATSETITHTGFTISGGDDMFVLGDVGIKGDLYTDAEVILGNADNVDGFLNLADGTTAKPQITFGNGGSAPSSISTGDLWWTGTQLHFRNASGANIDLLLANKTTAKKLYLSPEYSGGTIIADGTNNTGVMSSDFCSNITAGLQVNTGSCGTAGDIHNFYNWTTTQGTQQDYDIYVRVQLPAEFASWASNPIRTWGWRTDQTNNAVRIYVYDSNNTIDANANGVSVATCTSGCPAWTQTSISSLAGTYTAGTYITIRFVMNADTNDSVKVGEVELNYNL